MSERFIARQSAFRERTSMYERSDSIDKMRSLSSRESSRNSLSPQMKIRLDDGEGLEIECPVDKFFDVMRGDPLKDQIINFKSNEIGSGDRKEDMPHLSSLHVSASTVPVPSMNIVIMIVGTRGDVHPFFGLGHLLQKDGHRVRIATHKEFETEVLNEGFEYYPLGGDPRRLSAFMVETSGRLVPNLMNDAERRSLPEKMKMINDIIQSTWPACTAPQPSDPDQKPFIADAIISNPVTYAHIHCAEALSVPLHLFFPQPWCPTHEFPHPFASMTYERGWCAENWYSYPMVDLLFNMGSAGYINELRTQIGLEPIRRGESGFNLLNNNHVPFVKMWSPHLVPKPLDWGPNIDIAGSFFPEPSTSDSYTPPPQLAAFLEEGEPPVFVGFGSMVIEDTEKLIRCVVQAAEATNSRVVMQSSWSTLRSDDAPDCILNIGSAPHDWLLPRMGAVVHHGGAGTVAAGLRAGKPTLVCPFFGDQFFWGHYIYERGVGPKPIPIASMTPEALTVAFAELKSHDMHARAEKMAQLMSKEDGIVNGLNAFYRHLPIEDMVCDVSIFCSETRIARCWCKECDLKLSWEADVAIHEGSFDESMKKHKREDYRFVNWGVLGPKNLWNGAREGLGGFAHELAGGIGDLVNKPLEGYNREGGKGIIKGVGEGLINVVQRPIRGGIILADKLATGGHNMASQLGNSEGQKLIKSGHIAKRYLFYDKMRSLEHRASAMVFGHTDSVTAYNVSKKRADLAKVDISEVLLMEMQNAYDLAMQARRTFDLLAPNSSVVKNKDIVEYFSKSLGLNESQGTDWIAEMIEIMDTSGDGLISFPEFCMFSRVLRAAETAASTSVTHTPQLGNTRSHKLSRLKDLVAFKKCHGCLLNAHETDDDSDSDSNADSLSSDITDSINSKESHNDENGIFS